MDIYGIIYGIIYEITYYFYIMKYTIFDFLSSLSSFFRFKDDSELIKTDETFASELIKTDETFAHVTKKRFKDDFEINRRSDEPLELFKKEAVVVSKIEEVLDELSKPKKKEKVFSESSDGSSSSSQ